VAAIRTNAAQIHRLGVKAGCALSVLLGWHNHSCRPNAAASIDADGLLRVVALRPIAMAEEVTISYVDTEGSLETRRACPGRRHGVYPRARARLAISPRARSRLGAHSPDSIPTPPPGRFIRANRPCHL
jgi:hypothetical protein